MRLRTLPLIAIVGTLGLAACADDDTSSTATTATQTEFNEADVMFAQGMIPHHEQAIEMADIALDPTIGASEQVRDLATRIKTGQDPEIVLMTGWLTAWGQPMQMDTGGGHDMSSMDGMMSAGEMDSLGMMSGVEFDSMWLDMMIRHHEGAVTMANDVKANGSNPDVLALADQVIEAQQAEIAEMQALLGS
ncbi:MAG: DUF305 domain-containing protein [Ilumatobacteraceae bacterium]